MHVVERIREDIRTVFSKDPAARSLWEVLCCYPGLHAIWLHRIAHWLWWHRLNFLGRLVSHLGRWLTGIEIHPGAQIGRRFFVDHGMGVVIGETAQIGDDVLLYQGVVLGGTTMEKTKRHPTVGSKVVIGSGAILLGPITVGENARIGAGSVVVRPVQPGATVVGVPARPTGQPDLDRTEIGLDYSKSPDPVVRSISQALDRTSRLEARVRELERALERQSQAKPAAEPIAASIEKRVHEALQAVIDPGIGTSLSECGFVDSVVVDGEQVEVRLLLDDSDCQFREYFVDQIRRELATVDGVRQILVTFLNSHVQPERVASKAGGANNE